MEGSGIVGHGPQVGLVVASAAVPATFTRSLSERSWLDQGIVTGLATVTHYLVSVVAQDGIDIGGAVLARVLPLPEVLTVEQRRRVAILLLDIAFVPIGFGLGVIFRFRDNDSQARTLVRQVGLRLGVTGTGATLLAGALAVTGALDDRLGASGRIAGFPVAVPVGLATSVIVERLRQRENANEHASDPVAASPVPGLAAGLGIVLALSGVAAAEGWAARLLGSVGGRLLPGSEFFWRLASHGVLVSAVGFGTHAVWGRAMRDIEAGTTKYDAALGESAAGVWTSPMISGDPESLVRWDTLGREGRRHAIAYVRPEPPTDRPTQISGRTRPDLSISTVMRENPRASPIQVFIGLDSAPTPADRVELALAEMDRTAAWTRSMLLLISPTGTGYVNYVATACVQYLTRGDVASVTLQYSKRPSPLSLGKVEAAREQNRLLWLRIFVRVRAMPPQDRPKVVLFGESLGALTSQNVLTGWGTLGLQALGIDRALWVGTPEGSRWMHEVAGKPRPDVDKSLVALVNDYEQFCELGDEQKERVRYVLLSHDNDGVTKFGPSLINRRPGWLGLGRPTTMELPGRSPRGIPSSMRWRMVTTFYQSLIDMKNAQTPGAYRAWAHDYRPDLADFIRDVFDLECTPEQLQRIKAACREREEFREGIFQ
jgi:uncharacterized membrane protein